MKLPCRFIQRLMCVAPLLAAVWAGAQPFGLSNRVPNTTLRVPQTLPVFGWTNVNAFPGVVFTNPIAIASPPGETNRLFIVERPGRVAVITNLAAPNYNLFLRIPGTVLQNGENGLLGLAFHPGYATNGLFFVFYSLSTTTPAGSGTHQRVARFAVSTTNANVAATNETVLLTMFDEASNHNGGCLQFGPDGHLYVSLGDEGNQNDSFNNSQIIDKDYWASLLRLDVDKRPGSLNPNPHAAIAAGTTNFAVPADNPFVNVTNWYGSNLMPSRVRTEMYAIGLRNPWRFSFDGNLLYCGDVGGGVREEIDIITLGGNYGWAFREGKIAGPKAAPPGAMAIDPIFDYPHGAGVTNGNSITGGIVYRGSRYPQLFGRYVFADYETDNVWSLLYTGGVTVTEFQRLTIDSDIAAFGVDPRNGDVLMADLVANQIKRLVETNIAGQSIPATLEDSGAFSSLVSLTPHAGILPYEVNAPYWADGALKSQWFHVPTNVFVTFRATQNWSFPTGSVWIQQLDLELTNGAPASRRRVETRLLVRDGASAVYGLSYRWNAEQTNATLVDAGGLDEPFVIDEGGGILRTQVWRYPARTNCLSCHTPPSQGGQALAFNTAQLNRNFDYANGVTDNQLRSLANAGYFLVPGATPATNLHALRALAHPADEDASVEQRVRSYLHANCAACHSATLLGQFEPRIFPSLPGARLVNGALNNNGGNPNARVVVPNSLSNSMLWLRLLTNGTGHLPVLGAARPNPDAIALVERWITNDLAGYQTFAEWQVVYFGATNAVNGLAGDDFDDDNAPNLLEYLTGTNPTNSLSAWDPIGIERNGSDVDILYSRLANRWFEVQCSTNLGNTNAWRFLNVPGNRPYMSSTNGVTRVTDSATNPPAKFYRVRVLEP